eukprot:Skav230783  [mRNA]  locus=scaffold1473:239139:241498:- [translate_table: standard]
MSDPVTAEDGHNYERVAIEKWLEKKTISPQTSKPMGKKLVSHEQLRQAIQDYQNAHEKGERAEVSWPTGGHVTQGMEDTRWIVVESAAATSLPSQPEEPKQKRPRLELEAAGSSMAQELSKFFRWLDPLRDLLLQVLNGWQPPRIVVIGDESSGKSTLLEQLANIPIFPRDLIFCTRMPIYLRLRRDPNPDASRALLYTHKINQDGSLVQEGENGWLFVQEEMTSQIQQSESQDGLVADRALAVEIHHPDVPSLDLVDEPGLAGTGDKKATIDKILQRELDYDQQNGNHDMFLVVMPAAGVPRPSTNMAVNFIKEKNLQERTFGVFSKCDQTFDTEVLRALVLNEKTSQGHEPEKLGQVAGLKSWTACMLKPPQENSERLQVHNFERLFRQAGNEKIFFNTKDENTKRLVNAERAGIPCLVKQLEMGYSDYLHKSWKKPAMEKILQKLKETEAAFKDLGVVDDQAQAVAEKEVKTRLSPDNPDVKKLYSDFKAEHLTPLREAMETRLANFTQNPQEVCKLKESICELETDLKNMCKGTAEKVLHHFVDPLKEILEREIPRNVRVRGKSRPWALCPWLTIGRNNEFIQLSRYPAFTAEIVEQCRNLFGQAADKTMSDTFDFITELIAPTSQWVGYKVNEEGTAVSITCEIERFVDRMEVIFVRCLPSPHDLSQAALGVKVGASDPESLHKASALKEELQKICDARDGLSKALFTEEELKASNWEM